MYRGWIDREDSVEVVVGWWDACRCVECISCTWLTAGSIMCSVFMLLCLYVFCWEAAVWVPALFNSCHSFLLAALLLSATCFPFSAKSLSRFHLFHSVVGFPIILPSNMSFGRLSCLRTCPSQLCFQHQMVFKILLVMAALRSRCGHYIFVLFLLSSFFPCLISAIADWMSDVYHTSTHGVALVWI